MVCEAAFLSQHRATFVTVVFDEKHHLNTFAPSLRVWKCRSLLLPWCVISTGVFAVCAAQRFASEIEREYGRCDILVNNAGFAFKVADTTPFE